MEEWHEGWAREVFRVLKPGAHLLAFGGSRTYHRLVCGIEDAGFEVRDTIAWIHGQGFPKSLDLGKAIDAAAGAEREVVGENPNQRSAHRQGGRGFDRAIGGESLAEMDLTDPATPDAEKWDGWATALKPAIELVCVARKPLSEKTVAANVLKWGTGAINVDGCRIATDEVGKPRAVEARADRENWRITGGSNGSGATSAAGRWPANLVLDEEAGRQMDEVVGESSSPERVTRGANRQQAFGMGRQEDVPCYGDNGGPSRFFYCPKASKRERSAGLSDGERNRHPTVKPIALMRWLCRLVTPPGGTVLDPLAGSGTTCVAAVIEGFRYLACERDEEYARIARARIDYWTRPRP